jgi:hypothetical protein
MAAKILTSNGEHPAKRTACTDRTDDGSELIGGRWIKKKPDFQFESFTSTFAEFSAFFSAQIPEMIPEES